MQQADAHPTDSSRLSFRSHGSRLAVRVIPPSVCPGDSLRRWVLTHPDAGAAARGQQSERRDGDLRNRRLTAGRWHSGQASRVVALVAALVLALGVFGVI